MDKAAWRRAIKARQTTPTNAQNKAITDRLGPCLTTLNPSHLCIYFAIHQEPQLDLARLQRAVSAQLFAPKYSDNGYSFVEYSPPEALKKGRFSVLEPVGFRTLSRAALQSSATVFIVPGLAFSSAGVRLGYGAGIYDRLLQATTGPVIGVCLDTAVCAALPSEEHDHKVHVIVTDTHRYECGALPC